MNYILYSKATSTTGRRLKEILGISGSTKSPSKKIDNLIRWGSSVRVKKKPRAYYNSRLAVERATDKLGSLILMRDSHVPVPDFWEVGVRVPKNCFPLLGRKVNHSKGSDIRLCMQLADLEEDQESQFFTQYVPVSREFRVHTFDGEILKISEKKLTIPQEKEVPYIRNFENGYTFHVVRNLGNRLKEELTNIAIRAMEAHRLLFGAADIILGDDDRFYVLEVNTGPALSDNSLEVYVEKFAEILDLEPNWPAEPEPDEEELEALL